MLGLKTSVYDRRGSDEDEFCYDIELTLAASTNPDEIKRVVATTISLIPSITDMFLAAKLTGSWIRHPPSDDKPDEPAPAPPEWVCPDHGEKFVRKSEYGGHFCAFKGPEGAYCRKNSKNT